MQQMKQSHGALPPRMALCLRGATPESVQTQRDSLRAHARADGYAVVGEYVDIVSGDAPKPELARLVGVAHLATDHLAIVVTSRTRLRRVRGTVEARRAAFRAAGCSLAIAHALIRDEPGGATMRIR